MRIFLKCVLVCVLFLTFASSAFAANDSFITIINPVRLSVRTGEPIHSLKAEYSQIARRELPGTWLMTYDILKRREMVKEFKSMDAKQELGIFLEVSEVFAMDSGVLYNLTGSWYRATSLFLSGYKQESRKKLIDTVFDKFKNEFGFYPKSVGAWWVDSYSLEYMQEKYGITGVLGVSDQYDLDGYQVWGTPWSVPYYPSKINAAIPAGNIEDKLNIVEFRWAPRDPLNGYISPTKDEASLYGSQDYERLNLSIEYFKDILRIYSEKNELNDFGQVTVGLEADYPIEIYNNAFGIWLDVVKELEAEGTTVTNMEEFSKWYRREFPKLSPASVIMTGDLLGTSKEVLWYQNPLYRVRVVYDKKTQIAKVEDLRIYYQNLVEPFYEAPNGQYFLSINLPYVIDSMIEKTSAWEIQSGALLSVVKSKEGTRIKFTKGEMLFSNKSISFVNFDLPASIKDSDQVSILKDGDTTTVSPKDKFSVGPEGILFSDFIPRVPFAIRHRVERFTFIIPITLLAGLGILIWLFFKNRKILFYCIAVFMLSSGLYLFIQFQNKYYISQSEYSALMVLAKLPKGNTLVYAKDCLRCEFVTKKPAAAAGIKDYVARYSGQNTVADFDFQTAVSSSIARQVLEAEQIKYVYITKYEKYIEEIPYPPQDMKMRRIYQNANAEIWEVE